MNSNGTDARFRLNLRKRVETFRGRDAWDEVWLQRELPAHRTALLLCDVWDRHWCRGAMRRVDQMVPRINQVVAAARAHGAHIVHAPSDTMDYYEGTPARERIKKVPALAPTELLPLEAPPLPIDDSDGGCDCHPQCKQGKAWSRQHPGIEIADNDAVSDDGDEITGYLTEHDIQTLVILGVHTNMCVLGRSFGIRRMTRRGVPCILVRDLTDSMYNPDRPPHVSHYQGTQAVIEHIERYWCPTVLSEDLMGVNPPA